MKVHACFLSKECREYGSPNRVYINTSKFYIIIGTKAQGWRPSKGNTKKWHFISIHPSKEMTCSKVVNTKEGRSGKVWNQTCGRLKNHRGPCYDWTKDSF